MKANNYFRENILQLLTSESKHKARAKWEDSTEATKTSIYQVFEKYSRNELPIHTYRDTAIKSAIQEMLWIYKDQTSCLTKAHERGIYWWDSFDIGNYTIGESYGNVIWQHNMFDKLLYQMKTNPFSQRHVLSLWQEINNTEQFSNGGLVPCAFLTQYTIVKQGSKRLVNMHLQIRSSDYITAGAINRIQYYCLGLMICGHLTYVTGLEHILNDFSVFTMDLHVYDRHEFAINELLENRPLNESYKIVLKGIKNFYDYDIEDFEIIKPKGLYKLSKKLELAV
mgnify:FL=1